MSRTVHPHIHGAYSICCGRRPAQSAGSSPHTWGIQAVNLLRPQIIRFIPTYMGHTPGSRCPAHCGSVHPHIRGAYFGIVQGQLFPYRFIPTHVGHTVWHFTQTTRYFGSSPHTWGIHWTAVRKMAGFSHFSYDFTRKSYFVQGLVFFGVIGAEASPTHRRGRSQCLPGAHGGSVRNL